MEGLHPVRIKVVSQKGRCSTGHRMGDEWLAAGKTPEGICLKAFAMLLPNIRTLMFGGSFPWETDKDTATFACPDAANPVVFELTREE